jgi:hypothetical protein
MQWRLSHTIALLAGAALWVALWYLAGALIYFVVETWR